MSTSACKEVLGRLRPEYQEADWQAKRELLDQFVGLTGYCRKHAITLLNAPNSQPPSRGPGRPRLYDEAVTEALARVWRALDCICGKRLVPFLPEMLCVLERCGHVALNEEVRSRLLCISPATADRLLRGLRTEPRRSLSVTSPDRLLKKQIAVRTHNDPPEPRPGYFEADLVAHCGPSARGQFLWTLVLTDVETGWTELMALADKSSRSVLAGIIRVISRLPYPFLGLDTDNGSEFINTDVFDYCLEHGIGFTRGRPYKKNDQAHVEERNGSVVRRVVGRERFEGDRALGLLEGLYMVTVSYQNCFQPMAKLLWKDRREGLTVTRHHDKAATPLQRTLLHDQVDEALKVPLRSMYEALDPVVLLAQMRQVQRSLRSCALGADPPPEQSADEALGSQDLVRVLSGIPSGIKWRKSADPRPCGKNKAPDPFADLEDEIGSALESEPFLSAARLFERMQSQYPGRFEQSALRALDRRVRAWRIRYGLSTKATVAAKRSPVYVGEGYRTRSFQMAWDLIGPILERHPYISAPALLRILQDRVPGTFADSQLRSMRRFLTAWRLEQSQAEQLIDRTG